MYEKKTIINLITTKILSILTMDYHKFFLNYNRKFALLFSKLFTAPLTLTIFFCFKSRAFFIKKNKKNVFIHLKHDTIFLYDLILNFEANFERSPSKKKTSLINLGIRCFNFTL